MGGGWLDTQAFPASGADVDGAELAALDTLQQCLPGDAQGRGGDLDGDPAGHDAALHQWRRQAEQARYAAARAERRYRAVDPENRLVARGLEAEWEAALQAARDADAELDRREVIVADRLVD